MRIARVQITQAAQDEQGTLPLIDGAAAVVNVLIARSQESAAQVPVVFRLYRGGQLVRSDTAATRTPLRPVVDLTAPSAQFLLPANVVTGDLSWEVELDPANTVTDSTRTDNRLPSTGSTPIRVVVLPGLEIRFVPIVLASNGNATGNVSDGNTESYLQTVREILPTGRITTSVGASLTTMVNFGTSPRGGAQGFWTAVLQEVDVARLVSTRPAVHWYGVVSPPVGFNFVENGGWAYIPNEPTSAAANTRTSVGMTVGWFNSPTAARDLVAHELSHTFGRRHNTSCNAGAPLDASFPDAAGTILLPGHNVWSWARGVTTEAPTVSSSNGDIMGYCFPAWIGAYTWNAVRIWREAAITVTASVVRTPAIIVAGSVTADGRVSLRPALEAEVAIPASDPNGDVRVELRDANGQVIGQQSVTTTEVDHAAGERHFIAIFPAAQSSNATTVIATGRSGQQATIRARNGSDGLSALVLPNGSTDVRSATGRAILLRDSRSGEPLGIGWNGRIVVQHRGPMTATISNGIRNNRHQITPR
jgi:hypothetical protein